MAYQKSLRITFLTSISCLFLLLTLNAHSTPKCIDPFCTEATGIKPYLFGQMLYDFYPYSMLYYYGITLNNNLTDLLTFNHLKSGHEHVQSLEFMRTLSTDNFLRRLFSPLVGVVQLAMNVAVRQGKNENTIYEFDPYIGFRWANFPWNKYVVTSFALGEGISYATAVPEVEKKSNSDQTKRFLNFLMIEVTFAVPTEPCWQLILRIHHRSGANGLYGAKNAGSNAIGLAIRYLFD